MFSHSVQSVPVIIAMPVVLFDVMNIINDNLLLHHHYVVGGRF